MALGGKRKSVTAKSNIGVECSRETRSRELYLKEPFSAKMRSTSALALGFVSTVMLIAGTSAEIIPNFDFFYFVVQWPGSYCNLQSACCCPTAGKPASNFSIHGLWPNYNDGTWPQYCDPSDTFDYSQIEDLVPELNQHWRSLTCPSSNSTRFWKHEWEKHGTCSSLSQHDYFVRTLAILKSIDLMCALRSAAIIPSSSATYEVSAIQKVLASAIGFTPGLECNTAKDRRNQLFQVYICVDKDAKTLIPCPMYPNGKCQAQVYWPTF